MIELLICLGFGAILGLGALLIMLGVSGWLEDFLEPFTHKKAKEEKQKKENSKKRGSMRL